MILRQAEQQARMLYKQILLTRQWASDHNGLFILKQKGQDANPYLDLPTVVDGAGKSYYLRNPAMITRELSTYAKRDGLGYFRVTSLQPVNPANTPDSFERTSLLSFNKGVPEIIAVDESSDGRVVRFMAPLLVTDSCLGCHARHGYSKGDIRGGLSITIPINWADSLIKRNIHSLLLIGVFSIIFVTIALFLMFEFLIVKRIHKLNVAMDRFPEEMPSGRSSRNNFQDELDTVTDNFIDFCDRLNTSRNELLQAKAKAHLSEKMASLGILSAGIAHEVNNPLGGMLNCVKAMRENPSDIEMTTRYLPLIDKGLRQIETILRQLLNFGRSEPLHIQKVDFRQILGECTDLLSYRLKSITLRTDIALDGEYMLDADALKQIIINIGLNAIQAMKCGGELFIGAAKNNDTIILTFKDTGTGISDEDMSHIFDPFFTTKEGGEGTGLGLAVTYTLDERMKGSISVESTIGKGTTFTIAIPCEDNALQSQAALPHQTQQEN